MYKITSNGEVRFANSIRYIDLHRNGCYVESPKILATGICAKMPVAITEDGYSVSDEVFAIVEGGLKGTEPFAIIEENPELTTEEMLEWQQALGGGSNDSIEEALAILNGEVEE